MLCISRGDANTIFNYKLQRVGFLAACCGVVHF